MGIGSRLSHAWNAFTDQDAKPSSRFQMDLGPSYGIRPDRYRSFVSNERSILASILTRIAIDVTSVDIRHVRLDDEGRYESDMNSGLNNCLSVEANIDQAGSMFRQDMVRGILTGDGVAAVVPVDTSLSPVETGGYEINTLRVGTVVQWYPSYVRVRLYNEQTGREEDVTLAKSYVALIENPLHAVMNEPNSTLQRIIRKLSQLDAIDEQSSSGKLDLIIQVPYTVRSEGLKQKAEQRRTDIEMQLKGSKYGIAYADGTEKIVQLNRPAENNLLGQIEYLMKMLYGQLGITEEIMNGTADEAAMLNYYVRTVEPILRAISEEFNRKFLTKTARTQKQAMRFFRDPFAITQAKDMAEMADKFARNEIFTANELRGFMGIKPHPDAKADLLQNSNMPYADPSQPPQAAADDGTSAVNDAFDQVDAKLDSMFSDLGGEPEDDQPVDSVSR